MKRITYLKTLLVGLLVCGVTSAWADETKTSVYSNDFEASSDWTAKGKTDGWTCNPGTTTANTFNSTVIGVGAGTGDMGLVSPSMSFAEGVTLVDVELKFKLDACTSGKSSGIDFITSDVNINNGYVSSGTPFFSISASASGNGYWGAITVNGTDYTSILNQTGTYENNALNRNTTGIVTLNVRFNFTAKTATFSMSRGGSEIIASTVATFANTNATTLDRIFLHAGKTYGGATLDDVKVYSVESDDVETTYLATFTETNSLNPTVTIYGNSEMTEEVTNGLLEDKTTYYYKATLAGYYDYTGSFTVSGENPTVSYTMTAKPVFTYTKRAICGSEVLNETLATGSAFEGETVTLTWNKYINIGNQWYVATNNTFKSSSTVGATEDVEYLASDIAYFFEMEGLTRVGGAFLTEEDASYSKGARLRLSKGSLYYTPALSAGEYVLNIGWVNTNSSAGEVYVYTRDAEGQLSEVLATLTAGKGSGTFTAIISVPEGCSIAFNGNEGSSNNNARMDYMTLKVKPETFTFTVNAVNEGNEVIKAGIASKEEIVGKTISLTWSKYIKVDDQWYVTDENEFKVEATETGEKNVVYKPAGIAYFFEMEGLTRNGGTYLTEENNSYSNGSRLRLSRGSLYYTSALAEGVYALNIAWENGNSGASEVYVYTRDAEGNLSDKLATFVATKGSGVFAATINVPEGHSIAFNGNEGGSANNNARMDYMTLTEGVAVNISKAGYATFCSPYDVDFAGSGITAYLATVAGEEVSFEATEKVPANTGVLLKGNKGSYVVPTTTGATGTSALIGVTEDTQLDAGIFVLMNSTEGVGFYKTTNQFTVGANTAYLPAQASARGFIAIDGEATGISAVNAEQQGAEVYNLNGQRVSKAQKGLYIQNGKKVIMK